MKFKIGSKVKMLVSLGHDWPTGALATIVKLNLSPYDVLVMNKYGRRCPAYYREIAPVSLKVKFKPTKEIEI